MNKTLSRWSGRGRVLRRAGRGGQEASCGGGKVGWIPSSHEGGLCGGACQCRRRNKASCPALRAGGGNVGLERQRSHSPCHHIFLRPWLLGYNLLLQICPGFEECLTTQSGIRKSDGHLTYCRPLEGVWHLRSFAPL